MMRKTVCALMLAATLAGTQAGAWDGSGITMSYWAQEGVAAAYESGAVSDRFDLGTDYTIPITRAQMARLTVDLVIGEQQTTLADLAGQLGIQLEQIPLVPAEDSSDTENGAEENGTDPADPGEAVPADPVQTPPESDDPAADSDAAEQASPETDDPTAGSEEAEAPLAENPAATDSTAEDTLPAADDAVTDSEAEDISPATDEAEPGSEAAGAANGDPLDGGLPPVVSGSFSDTQSVYIETAAQLGIVNGANGLFRPDDLVSRAEAAAMMQRCMGVLGRTEANLQPQQFTDNYAIPRWAVESVKYVSGRTDLSGQAVMGGSGGRFSPQDSYTIEQAILSIGRMQSSLQITDVAEGWRSAPGYDSVTLTLTFGGDCTLGRGHDFAYSGSFDEMYDNKGASYFFSGIPEFFDDDLTMVNFEGTLTNATAHANKTFVFKGRPEYARVLDAGSIDVVSLANNHSMDYLQRGYDDTVRYLSPYVHVSAYDRMPIVTVKGVRIGFASNVGWSFDSAQKQFIDNAIRSLRERGAELIVFNYHWGIERSYHSDPTQQAIGHYCIDQGADLVIGHHPHVVQEVETYKGKQIAYSLGNLVFGGNNNPSDKNCLIYRHTFTLDLDSRQVTASSHQAIPYSVSSVSWRNDYHPVKR